MDLFDHPAGPQPFMRRYFKPLLVFVSVIFSVIVFVGVSVIIFVSEAGWRVASALRE